MDEPAAPKNWMSEYEFYHRIITDEVERGRFNDGFEPIDVDLYQGEGDKLSGKTRIGRTAFRAKAFWCVDQKGVKILRVQIRAEPK